MIKKIIIAALFFYFLTLFQVSFLAHFFNSLPNFVFITIILISLFESQKNDFGIWAAFFGGFFLDIFSENFIGFYILISLFSVFFIKFIFKKHISWFERQQIHSI